MYWAALLQIQTGTFKILDRFLFVKENQFTNPDVSLLTCYLAQKPGQSSLIT